MGVRMATDYKTLRVPAEQYEAAKAQKEATNRTWGQQIVRPDGDSNETGVDVDAEALAAEIRAELGFDGDPENVADVDALAEAVADRINRHDGTASSLATIEERTGRIERALDDLQQ